MTKDLNEAKLTHHKLGAQLTEEQRREKTTCKRHFELNELALACGQYSRLARLFHGTDQRISLVVSLHDYSLGLFIEFGLPKIKQRGEKTDFVIAATHGSILQKYALR